MTTYERILKTTRIDSPERARLVAEFAAEKNISMSSAYRRVYAYRQHVNSSGDLKRKIRSDCGKARKHAIKARIIAQIKLLLADNEKRFIDIARELNVSPYVVRRIAHGHLEA